MSDLVVIVYRSEDKAEEVRQRLFQLQKEYLDQSRVMRSSPPNPPMARSSCIKSSTRPRPGLRPGRFWGLLVGVLFLNPLLGAAVGAASAARSAAR